MLNIFLNLLGNPSGQVLVVINPDQLLQATDILVLSGHFKVLEKLLEKE